jgi:peptide/nickel transport system permease protein
VSLALLVNFVGDGLRDAFDPRHRRFNLSKMRETRPEPELETQP